MGSKVTEEWMEERDELHHSHLTGECVGYEAEIAEIKHIWIQVIDKILKPC